MASICGPNIRTRKQKIIQKEKLEERKFFWKRNRKEGMNDGINVGPHSIHIWAEGNCCPSNNRIFTRCRQSRLLILQKEKLEERKNSLKQNTKERKQARNLRRCASITCKTCKIYCWDCWNCWDCWDCWDCSDCWVCCDCWDCWDCWDCIDWRSEKVWVS